MLDFNIQWRITGGIDGAMSKNDQFTEDMTEAVERFIHEDWGEVPQEDKEANDRDLRERCGRVVARYKTCIDDIYIILEGDFETATILFCKEY